MNLAAITPSSTQILFADAMKHADPAWRVVQARSPRSPWSLPATAIPTLSADGWPTTLGDLAANGYALSTSVWTGQGGHYPSGIYALSFRGSGKILVDDGRFSLCTVSQGRSGPVTPVPIEPGPMGVMVTIVQSDPSDPVRDIQLVLPGHQGETFYRPILEALAPFRAVRVMEALRTNDQPPTAAAARTSSTYRTAAGPTGISVGDAVQLANTLGNALYWSALPFLGDADQLAEAQAVAASARGPVILEVGNELWNYAHPFGAAAKAIDALAAAPGEPHDAITAELTARAFRTWSSAWSAAGRSDLTKVVASQWVEPARLDTELARLDALEVLPDAVAGAPYASIPPATLATLTTFTARITVDDLVGELRAVVETALPAQVAAFRAVRDRWAARWSRPLPIYAYECGLGLTCPPGAHWAAAFAALQRSPSMYRLTIDLLRTLGGALDLACYYALCKRPDMQSQWGAMAALDEAPAARPKYQAAVDVAWGL